MFTVPAPEKRARAVAMAAAKDLNDELTIIVNCAAETLARMDADDPLRPSILDLRTAAQRCAWKASGLLNWGARSGIKPEAVSMERLVLWDAQKRLLAVMAMAVLAGHAGTTTVSQTIYGPDGNVVNGRALIRISAACIAGSTYVGTRTIVANFSGGVFSQALEPNDACVTAAGTVDTTYTVNWMTCAPVSRATSMTPCPNGGLEWTETWVVPTSSMALTVGQVNGGLSLGSYCLQVVDGVVTRISCGGGTLSWRAITNAQALSLTNAQALGATN
jgi:hypothetical protein